MHDASGGAPCGKLAADVTEAADGRRCILGVRHRDGGRRAADEWHRDRVEVGADARERLIATRRHQHRGCRRCIATSRRGLARDAEV